MLAAGAFRASWHAIAKGGSSLAILAGMGAVSLAIAIPFSFVVPMPVSSVWPIITISVCLHGTYKLSLSQAYSSADFSNARIRAALCCDSIVRLAGPSSERWSISGNYFHQLRRPWSRDATVIVPYQIYFGRRGGRRNGCRLFDHRCVGHPGVG